MPTSTTSYFYNFYCRRRRRWRTIATFLILLSLCSLFVSTMLLYNRDSNGQNTEVIIDLSNNYLQVGDKFSQGNFLVDTPKCRIPDLDIWDVGVRPFVKPPSQYKCPQTYLSLTHVVKDTVVINETALQLVGYTLDEITCCYQTIERINQDRESYNMNADNLYRYSEECFEMEKTTKPKASFIKVACKAKGVFEGYFTYSNFHMVALLPPDQDSESSRKITKKLAWWKDCLSKTGNVDMGSSTELCQRYREHGRPPNVLLIGWDSSSRLNFHRFMHRTVDILENIIKPVEMVGYNKVGENTFPNFVPLMSSLTLSELEKECFSNSTMFQDDCPYLWKKFDEHNYITGFLEDAPKIAAFNYYKTGFLKPPVDIYSRSFMLAAYEEKGGGEDFIDCIGYQRPEEIFLNYIVDLATLAETEQIPYFLTTWLTDLTHHDMNNLQLADVIMAKTLLKLHEKGLLENTILYLISDHGYRFLEIRSTTIGWFEDKLPALWIKLPPAVIKEHPSWMDSLQGNSRQLVTPFDLHQSFREILAAYSLPVKKESPTESFAPRIRSQSPFSKLPTRSCQEAEIPIEYCSCIPPTSCNFNSLVIKSAAEKVVEIINAEIPPECTPLSVDIVTACGILKERTTSDPNNKVIQVNTSTSTSESYIPDEVVLVTFKTKPGDFIYEAMVHFNKSTQQFGKVIKYMRMNKKTNSSSCLRVKDSWIELICYCDTFSILNTFLHGIF